MKSIKEETTPYRAINLMPGMHRVIEMEMKDQHRELEKVKDQRTKKEHGYKEEEDGTNEGATLIAERQDQARKKEENSSHTVRGTRTRGGRERGEYQELTYLTLLKYMLQRK